MLNYQLLIIIAITITELVCYGKSSQSCIFIGCACQRERVRCPLEPIPMSMFPKRRIVEVGTVPANLSIDLSSNRLEMVPDDRFADLDVHMVDLSGNEIVRISPDAFRDLVRLTHLSLASNRLRLLSANLFNPVKNSLETLVLSANQLGEMETTRLANVFVRLSNLKRLDLSSNRLFDLPDLTPLEHLDHLNLRGNELETLVDSETLDILLPSSLVELYLDDNQLKHISENWFENLASLRHLSMSNNQISAIAEKSFEKLTSLITINLSHNMLKHIPSEIIYTLNSLEVLDLSSQSQPIQRIDDYAFNRESNKKPIRRVLLHNNSIWTIGKRAFCVRGNARSSKHYANIREIDLSRNQLANIDSCVLRQLARGYSEPIYTSKLKLYSKVILNRDRTSDEVLIECSCEITRANKLLDLEGFCRRSDSTTVYLNQYDCGDYTITNANQVNKFCASRTETECIATTNMDNFQLTPNQEYSSWTISTTPTTLTASATSTPETASPTLPFNQYNSNKTEDLNNQLPYSSNQSSNLHYSSLPSPPSNSTSYNKANESSIISDNNNDQVDLILVDKTNQSDRGMSSSSVISTTTVSSRSSSSSMPTSSSPHFLYFLSFYSFLLNSFYIFLSCY